MVSKVSLPICSPMSEPFGRVPQTGAEPAQPDRREPGVERAATPGPHVDAAAGDADPGLA